MRILLVEDAVEVSAAMVDLLATRDHSADVVTNVADAVSLIRSDEFDLIVLDDVAPASTMTGRRREVEAQR
ncbi:MAG: response regulator [Acidimicrobiia bacterium]|nr:response regulator [Acidimicrobiia bacterium]